MNWKIIWALVINLQANVQQNTVCRNITARSVYHCIKGQKKRERDQKAVL